MLSPVGPDLQNPITAVAAVDRVVRHAVILELQFPAIGHRPLRREPPSPIAEVTCLMNEPHLLEYSTDGTRFDGSPVSPHSRLV